MNNIKVTPLAIAFFIASIILFWLFFQSVSKDRAVAEITNFEECVAAGNAVMESYPRQCRAEGQTFVENIGNELEKISLIRLSSPRPNQEITSPLVIEGEARGFWFFEGDFPIELQDENGEVIVRSFVTANGDWMTEEFVPFTGELIFDTSEGSGTLILKKDNPSDLRENDDELIIPVTIGESVSIDRGVLKGKVTVGPICPVEREGVPCDIPPEVYTSRELIVYSETGKNEVARLNFNTDGSYEFDLVPGTYVIDIPNEAIERSDKLPQTISIKSGESIEFNFSIDTGVR